MKNIITLSLSCLIASSSISYSQDKSPERVERAEKGKLRPSIQTLEGANEAREIAGKPDVKIEEKKLVRFKQARENMILELQKDISTQKNIPKVIKMLHKNLVSNEKYAYTLIDLIGKKEVKQVNSMLPQDKDTILQVVYLDADKTELTLKFCANFNGVRHCFPSQRPGGGIIKCPSWK